MLKLEAVNEPKEIATSKKNNFRLKVFSSISVRHARNYGSTFIYCSNKNQEGEGKKSWKATGLRTEQICAAFYSFCYKGQPPHPWQA